MNNSSQPKLVFFQFKHDANLSKFVLLHRQQHTKCLSNFFDVSVINEDCDYQQICDQYQPDIALFESGVNYRSCYRLKIKNTHTHPKIPKLGLHNGDSWCEARAGFLSDMEHWGIETFFSICTTTSEHTPEIAGNLFVWPNCIDADIYRDYGQPKIVPVMFTGYINPLYPWRQKINKIISEHYPSLICPHLGYEQPVSRMLYGEQYARVINASWFVPACGTLAKEVVRKHFEIPASKSCLVTEKSPALEAAGFIDMQNCIFADEHDVLDKLDYLFQHQEELEKITNAGYQLVHSRHTLKQRDQIFQWFNLYKDLEANQRIVQINPFEPLTIVEKSLKIKNSHIICNGLDIALLHQGDAKLWAGKYEEAEVLYLECYNHIPWMPEPKLRLTLCNLYKGNAKMALDWIVQPIKYTLENYKAFDPDPVEWAYGIISLLCLGKLDAAVNNANQFPSLSHPELNRIRWVINLLKAEGNIAPLIENESLKYRYSIHQLPSLSFNEWINNLCIILNSCQQFTLTELLKNYFTLETSLFSKKENANDRTKEVLGKQVAAIRLNWFTKLPVLSEIAYILNPYPFKNSLIVRLRIRLKLKTRLLQFSQKLKIWL